MTMPRLFPLTLALTALVGFGAGYARRAQAEKPAAGGAGGAAGAAAPTNCKAFGGGKCCDPEIMAHLPKAAVFKACGESDASYLGEVGSKETCKYVFKVDGGKPDETIVEVYAPAQKEVPDSPTDPFFSYKRLGKVYATDKAKSPKSAPMMISRTGLWMPGKGYTVSVSASTKVCTKAEAFKLAPSIK